MASLFSSSNHEVNQRLFREHLKQKGSQTSGMAANANLRPLSDPLGQAFGHGLALGNTGCLLRGKIVDTTSLGNIYKVVLENGVSPVAAVLGVGTTLTLVGAKDIGTAMCGNDVLCYYLPTIEYVIIVAVIPPRNVSGILSMQTVLHGATRQRVDQAHKQPYNLSPELGSATAGRLFDSIGGGEAGFVSETGMRVFIDSFMAMIGMDEASSLTYFYHDMLTRFSAYNLQEWTAVTEKECFNDQDESLIWQGFATYPWENQGLMARADGSIIHSAQQWQVSEPHLGKMDLAAAASQAWHRVREWEGYLGQGGKRLLVAPAKVVTDNGDKGSNSRLDVDSGNRAATSQLQDGVDSVGLADDFTTLGGQRVITSVKGVSLSKRGIVISPTRKTRANSADGDTEQNYKFSSILGTGPAHKTAGQLAANNPVSAVRQRVAGLLDRQTYLHNYANLHPFLYHRKDFNVPEESASTHATATAVAVPNFSALTQLQEIDVEAFAEDVFVDHRVQTQKVYGLGGSVDILDDGTVVIRGHCGEEIQLSGGNIRMSCPGDCSISAGRSILLDAGRDVIMRANKSMDLSTTIQSIRIKSGDKLDMLGMTGVLVESQGSSRDYDFTQPGNAEQYGGIVLKSTGDAVICGAGIYMRSQETGIVLDAAKGGAPLTTFTSQIVNCTSAGEQWLFGVAGDTVSGPMSEISADGLQAIGNGLIGGNLRVVGDIEGSGNLSISGVGQSSSELWNDIGGYGNTLQDDLRLAQHQLTRIGPQGDGQDFYDANLMTPYYDDNKVGNDDVLATLGFTFRTDANYNVPDYKVFENNWQQLARLAGHATDQWQERAVKETYPFPGNKAYTGEAYVQQGLTLFDATTGIAKDRGMTDNGPAGIYAEPTYAAQTKVSLQFYSIIG